MHKGLVWPIGSMASKLSAFHAPRGDRRHESGKTSRQTGAQGALSARTGHTPPDEAWFRYGQLRCGGLGNAQDLFQDIGLVRLFRVTYMKGQIEGSGTAWVAAFGEPCRPLVKPGVSISDTNAGILAAFSVPAVNYFSIGCRPPSRASTSNGLSQ